MLTRLVRGDLDHRLAFAEFVGVVEVGEVAPGEPTVGLSIRGWMTWVLILSPMSLLPLRAIMSVKLAPVGIVTGGAKSRLLPYLSLIYLINSMKQDVVLVLAGIHAAP